MIYSDPVYGPIEINEPVLLDLMECDAMQRLHGVLQHGISGLIGVTRETSRFEHSMGVMHLVDIFGSSLEEKIAALLHDVSHTAFSHVIDYVFGGHETQGYHEEHKVAYISGTDVPQILESYGYNWEDFMREEDFSILEQDLPHLCADRLDYFLRDARDLGLASNLEVTDCLENLTNFEGKIAATNRDIAQWLGYTFIKADQSSWANFREVELYELAAMAIRRGLEIRVLKENDIWGMDRPVWEKLNNSADAELQFHLQRVNADTKFEWDDENPEFRISTKLRSVDPDVLDNGKIKPLSLLDRDFKRFRSEYISNNSGKWPMRVISNLNIN